MAEIISVIALIISIGAFVRAGGSRVPESATMSTDSSEIGAPPHTETQSSASAPALADTQPQTAGSPVPSTASSDQHSAPPAGQTLGFLSWLAHEWPLKLGALLIIIGFIWFLSYAFLNNLIGPIGRFFVGLGIGSGLLVYSVNRIKEHPSQGAILVGLAGGILLLTTAYARFFLDIFNPTIMLLFLALVMATIMTISVRFSSQSVAIIALIIGYIAPLVVDAAPDTPLSGLFAYLLLITVPLAIVSFLKRWYIVSLLSMVAYWFYTASSGSVQPAAADLTDVDELIVRVAGGLFVLIFGLQLSVLSALDRISRFLFASIVWYGLLTVLMILALVPDHLQVFAYSGFGILAALMALRMQISHQTNNTAIPFATIGFLHLSLAVFTISDTMTTILVLTVLAFVYSLGAIRLFGVQSGKWFLMTYALPLLIAFSSVPFTGQWESYSEVASLTLLIVSIGFSGQYIAQTSSVDRSLSQILRLIAGIIVLIWIWKSALTFGAIIDASEHFSRMIALVCYTVVGITAYVRSEFGRYSKILYWYGLGVIGLVIFRLFLIEFWGMELFMRIITFFVVGGILMASILLRRSSPSSSLNSSEKKS